MVETDFAFDADALHARYREERDKRLRPDALAQYVGIEQVFPQFAADPYVEPGFTRDARENEVGVLVIGGGFGGLLTAARLRQAGIRDITVVEKGGDFGGTWYWNRYPGAACDVESYIYLPLLEEVGVMPDRKYARGPEIFEHCRAIGRKFDLYRDALFQTKVTELRWDEPSRRWTVSTDRGDRLRARFVVMANGPLDHPKLPAIPGVEQFRGHSFHTSRWDYAYTGGSSEGGLTGLADKVVGVIGTGATAVQCIPHLGEGAKQLYVFQRTPSSIDVRDDRPTDPDWVAGLTPGWQQRRMDNFTTLTAGGFADEDLVADGWTDVIANVVMLAHRKTARGEQVDDPATLTQLADFQKMEQIRARVDQQVEDSAIAETLKPYYNQFCKRPCFHDGYLPTFNRPNVTLVDTGGRGVERITEDSVIVQGRSYKVDCLVYATGFEVGLNIEQRMGYPTIGSDGVALTEKFRDGASTLHGLQSHGFPNCFFLLGMQAGFAINFVHMIDSWAQQIGYILGEAQERGATRVEVTQDSEQNWVDEIMRAAPNREAFLRECTPGYYNYEGDVTRMNARNGAYGLGPQAYVEVLRRWREAGTLAGVEMSAG